MSQSLKLLGATLTSNNTTSVADFSNFAKVKVAASNADDAAARNDYVNQKITDLGNSVLKLSSSIQSISATGEITADSSYLMVGLTSDSNNTLSNITAVNTLENGTVIILQAIDPSSTIIVSNNINIRLNNGVTCSLTGYNNLQLVYSTVSNSWHELSRTSIAAPTRPNLSLQPFSKLINDSPFSLTSLVSTNGTGNLSFSSSNTDVATISDGDTVTIVGSGNTNITVTIAASNDGVYTTATTTAILTVLQSTLLVLDSNGVTIKTIPPLSELLITSFPLFIYENPRGNIDGSKEWFAIVNDSSKSMITSYASGFSTGIDYFRRTPESPPVIFNNIVTTFMKDMSNMFNDAQEFNHDIGSWDTSNVTNMSYMFYNAQAFNNNESVTIGNWDTSKVTNMSYMFCLTLVFNQNIGSWDTSKVDNMNGMFANAMVFNNKESATIGNWDTSKVTNMRDMFYNATNFYQNISTWVVNLVSPKPPLDFSTDSALNNNTLYWPPGF
jgi:surface protein